MSRVVFQVVSEGGLRGKMAGSAVEKRGYRAAGEMSLEGENGRTPSCRRQTINQVQTRTGTHC